MNYVHLTPLSTGAKQFIHNSLLLLRQMISFRVLKFNSLLYRRFKVINKGKPIINKYTLHICQSTYKLRSWVTYEIHSLLSRNIIENFSQAQPLDSDYLRIIVPRGIRRLKSISINIELFCSDKLGGVNVIKKKAILSGKKINYFRNINFFDLPVKNKIKSLAINSEGAEVCFQNIKFKENSASNTVFIVLDAVDYKSFLSSQAYQENLSKCEHVLAKAYSPSSVTGSALPSLLTMQPVLVHQLGDYKEWFFSPNLECLSKKIPTLAENLSYHVDYLQAFTSFSKTLPFYSYHRGFSSYDCRCAGNNFSPSALDILNMDIQDSYGFFSELNSFFFFVHDIGAHPPIQPRFELTKDVDYINNSYPYTLNLSLRKVTSLIDCLSSTGKIDNTNIIITSDHTENAPGFSKNRYHLTSKRTTVPVYFRPSKSNNNNDQISKLNQNTDLHLPSTAILTEIFNSIYPLKLKHPEFSFIGINWLSSVFDYPDRENIYNLAYDDTSNQHLIFKTSISIFELNKINVSNDFTLYLLRGSNREKIALDSDLFKRVKESFLLYLCHCKDNDSSPVLQKELEFI
ncbi:hypothetical protein [Prochlorococcus sp. MIT 1307]|uniref:hypothetical protein n=1 Tax=Prochlorococcus sp. MIT 1307 TaxID=3096219 RepID=UPI002A75ABE5|nr:hypothetical protein [Prochlorococcus sp. MIT 1307]